MLCLRVGRRIDYNSGPYPVTITAGSDHESFNISVEDDNMVEGNETFILTIDMSSLPNEFVLGPVSQATVTIRDEDSKLLVIKNVCDYALIVIKILT